MKAKVGDKIVCPGNTVGAPDREGKVTDTGPAGGPPFTVRWNDGHESLFTPGSDAIIKPKAASRKK